MADLIFTDHNFSEEVLKSKEPVVVDFWAPWCTPCRIVGPVVDELAKEFEGKVKVGKLNVDENQQVSGQFNVMSIPTILFFKNGQPVDSVVGAQSKEIIKQKMEKLLSA
ncbi:MAG: thioredoxin [Candidatus Levybacteria bacterium]|nr:thioredoxin [Candidatus Levybacteria bacterium]